MKIITIIGARPQFIKAATVSRVIRSRPDLREIIVHTGQHYDENMSDVFFAELDIPEPDYNLGIGGTRHGAMTGRMLEKIEEVLLHEKPDVVLVYGDTNSTLAGALAAVKLHIPVAHVEAGLRSFNRRMPEEINRILTDHASDLLFAPTETAAKNLAQEGIGKEKVRLVGDVMYDAALCYAEKATNRTMLLERYGLAPGKYILATVHRAENTDHPGRLKNIMKALDTVAADIPVILPLHPRTGKIMKGCGLSPKRIHLVEPVGYLDMVALEMNAALIVTDSGGMQKEAYFHKVPCVTLRDETEWVELVEHGCNFLAGSDKEQIINAVKSMLNAKVDDSADLYGTGRASVDIVECLVNEHEQQGCDR